MNELFVDQQEIIKREKKREGGGSYALSAVVTVQLKRVESCSESKCMTNPRR